MTEKPTLYDRLEVFAKDGEISANLKLWKPQIKKLQSDGFVVDPFYKTIRHGEFFCYISWDKPTIPDSVAANMLKISISSIEKSLKS